MYCFSGAKLGLAIPPALHSERIYEINRSPSSAHFQCLVSCCVVAVIGR
jgi:hypothetical protein